MGVGLQMTLLILDDGQMSKIDAKLNLERKCNLVRLSLPILQAPMVTKLLKKNCKI
jgi:hypothetical protein